MFDAQQIFQYWPRAAIALLVALTQVDKASAQLELLVPVVEYLVADGLIDKAKGATHAAIEDFDRRIEQRVNQLGGVANEAVRRAGEELRTSIREAEPMINRAIDRAAGRAAEERKAIFQELREQQRIAFANIERQQQLFFNNLDRTVDRAIAQQREMLKNLENQASQELEVGRITLENATPQLQRNYGVSRVWGATQSFKPSGTYWFAIAGLGVGNGFNPTIKMDGKIVENSRQQSRKHLRNFEVPAELLNGKFHDTERGEAKLILESKEIKRFEQSITLLPRFPVMYEFHAITRGGTRIRGHALFPESYFTDADLERSSGERGQTQRRRLGTLFDLSQVRLRAGTNYVPLPPDAVNFELSATWGYSGNRFQLSRSRPVEGGIATTWQPDQNRIRIDVGFVEN